MSDFSPIATAVLDSLSEGVVVFDPQGRVVHANTSGREILEDVGMGGADADSLLPKLGRRGARIASLWSDGRKLGEAVILPPASESGTLAEQERDAILDTLRVTGGRLTESARRLGISRTTLWRRLRAYGLERGALKR